MKKQAAIPISHMAISASAGSGKTFQLAHRYIQLLASGVEADRIAAFTFSRKAAGEIFDSVARYLCQASSSEARAAETAQQVKMPHLKSDDFLRMLRELLHELQRLNIGTLDSFTVGVVQAFPMELGLSAEIEVMDTGGAAAGAARQEVLARIFQSQFIDRRARLEFLEAFKLATFGEEVKSLERHLDLFLEDYHAVFRATPAEQAWGDPALIWPDGCGWMEEVEAIEDSIDALNHFVAGSGWTEAVQTRWADYLEAVRPFGPHSAWTKPLAYLFPKLAAALESLEAGAAEVKINRTTCLFPEPETRCLLDTFRHVMATELRVALQRTRGVHRVLAQFERHYDQWIRRRGRLTFDDCQYLLAGTNPLTGAEPSTHSGDAVRRLYIDYRLDARLDHWLLDEFQDTSDLQWEVLANLIDEILQDASLARSFFYVGDVKQAIYGWRGGNARLFQGILERYRPVIREEKLATSYRSCQEVIDTVNAVFGSLPEGVLPDRAVKEWKQIWEPHTCAKGKVPAGGYAALLEPDCDGGARKPTAEDRYRAVAHILNEIQPLDGGLSVAVLVRTNPQATGVVHVLRALCPGMTVVHEGRAAIRDNPVVEQILALVKIAFHPGNTFAWRLVQMGPLWSTLPPAEQERGGLSLRLLREIHENGFRGFIRSWGSILERAGALDDFGRKRLRDLVEAAAACDLATPADGNAFLDLVEGFETHELASERAVRVMTVHQAKGLEFDIVFSPNHQEGGDLGKGHAEGLLTAREAGGDRPRWNLLMPRRDVALSDDVLREQLALRDVNECFEELCVMYVALTRAKRALYVVTSFPGKSSEAVTGAALVKMQLLDGDFKPVSGKAISVGGETLTLHYERGSSDWYRDVKEPVKPGPGPTPTLPGEYAKRTPRRIRLTAVTPSGQFAEERSAVALFEARDVEGMAIGSVVHDCFEQIAWVDEDPVEEILRSHLAALPGEGAMKEKAFGIMQRALGSEDVRNALSRAGRNVDLWREMSFEVVLGDTWVSGTFDRVEIERGDDGVPVRARILDYKTDSVESDEEIEARAERYRSQIGTYRKALARILGIGSSCISAALVFTRPGRVIDL